MKKLDELINELCPSGTEFVRLDEIAEIKRGDRITKKELLENGMYPVISGGTKPMGYMNKKNREANTITISSYGAAGYVDFQQNEFWANDVCLSVFPKDNVNNKYLYYALTSQQTHLYANTTKAIPDHIPTEFLKALKIPLPPLTVQSEIVKILDKFTLLSAELSAELSARKKQYEYYLNSLMDFSNNDSIEYKSVGELFEIRNGLNKEKDAFGKGYPIINFTDVFNNRWLNKESFSGLVQVTENEIERYSAKKGDVFFTRTSETKEDIGMSSTLIEDVPNCVFSGFVLRARPTTNLLLPKFCAYYFSTHKVRNTIVRYASFTTRATTTGPKLSKILVPILPISEQEKIVQILDKFDELCNDSNFGIPAEIEARRQQYEYYRDKLLTFKEKVNE